MDEMYWKQYEADLIKGYMLSVMQFKGNGEYDLKVGLQNAKFWARLTVNQIKESLEEY
jgi:hypothetical protein